MNFFEKAQARAQALEVLGLDGHPNSDEIRATYKKLAKKTHPDQGENTAAEFAKINEAYTLLKDDDGYCAADRLRPAPEDSANMAFRPKSRRAGAQSDSGDAAEGSTYVAPRRLHTAMTARVYDLKSQDAAECRTLLDDISQLAEPEPEEKSIRASVVDAIKTSGAPHVPHTNHMPYAIRQSGRRISYMVKSNIEEGVNRVAVPTGAFTDNRKVMPTLVKFTSVEGGAGTHDVDAATLAESFPGAKSVRLHFGMDEWPDTASQRRPAYA